MNIVSFMICDSINPMPGGAPALVAPQIVLRPQFIPSNFSFGIAVGVAGVDLQQENTMKFIIQNPTGVTIQDSGTAALPKADKPDSLPAKYSGFLVNLDIRNLPIHDEGEYEFSFYVNEELVGKEIIPVFKRN